jgi:hypothetical protein
MQRIAGQRTDNAQTNADALNLENKVRLVKDPSSATRTKR